LRPAPFLGPPRCLSCTIGLEGVWVKRHTNIVIYGNKSIQNVLIIK
jgi:hypothetical protein